MTPLERINAAIECDEVCALTLDEFVAVVRLELDNRAMPPVLQNKFRQVLERWTNMEPVDFPLALDEVMEPKGIEHVSADTYTR